VHPSELQSQREARGSLARCSRDSLGALARDFTSNVSPSPLAVTDRDTAFRGHVKSGAAQTPGGGKDPKETYEIGKYFFDTTRSVPREELTLRLQVQMTQNTKTPLLDPTSGPTSSPFQASEPSAIPSWPPAKR